MTPVIYNKTMTINYTHLYTSKLFLPREEQEVGADGFQSVKGPLQTLKVASSLASERVLHHLVETDHAKSLTRIWLIGSEQSRRCGE